MYIGSFERTHTSFCYFDLSRFQLKPYQLIGQNCLTLLYQNNLSGILADEMASCYS